MLSSNPTPTPSQIINPAFHQPAPLTVPANPSTQGTQSTQRPHLSIVLFLKNDLLGALADYFAFFEEDSHYAALPKYGQDLLRKKPLRK
jgi:hypothetical protein